MRDRNPDNSNAQARVRVEEVGCRPGTSRKRHEDPIAFREPHMAKFAGQALLSLEQVTLLAGIHHATVGLQSCRGGHVRLFEVARSENVKHTLAGSQ
jgi:hypothetical protein